MRIILIGQAAFGEKALQVLVQRGEEIVHVFPPPDPAPAKPDSLKTRALEMGIPVSQPRSFKSDAVYDQFKSLDADLAIMAFVTAIIPERVLYAPRYRSICFHPSLLPRHRGASAINWALIAGETETGVTWFWADKGIDTGPILIQKRVPIDADDTVGSIYFSRLFPLGIEAMVEAVDLIRAGRAPAIIQDESLATYEPPCGDEHARLDFSKPPCEVHNLVRGCDPQPGAWAELKGGRLRLYESSLETAVPSSEAGSVIRIDREGMRIALSGATLLVKRVRLDPGGKKVPPADLAASGMITVGLRL